MPQTYNVGARSLFVTAIAWVFIVLAVLTSMSALVQNAAVASLMPGMQIATERMPLLTGLLIGYLPWFVGTGLVMSLATLASAIGLLVVAIFANLLGLWLQQEVVQSVVSSAAIPQQAMGVFGGFVTAARVMAVLMTLAGCAALGGIIGRLMSPSVRQEFA